MRAIKLMADYHCFPLWEASLGVIGNIDPNTLPISRELCAELLNWAKSYDATLNDADPTNSSFASEIDEVEFKRIGRALGERLQGELGDQFKIVIKI